MRIHGWMVLAGVAITAAGCGGNGANPTAANGKGPAGVTSVRPNGSGDSPADGDYVDVGEPPIEATASPAEVVTFFLEALKAGDKTNVAASLTKKARQETSREGLVIDADGAPNAKFEVGSVEYVGPRKDGAHVQCLWTVADEEGNEISNEVIWVLRKQETGWRIAGMATIIGDQQEPEFLNFEKPQERLSTVIKGPAETARKDDSSFSPGSRSK